MRPKHARFGFGFAFPPFDMRLWGPWGFRGWGGFPRRGEYLQILEEGMQRTVAWLAAHPPTPETWSLTRYLSHNAFDYAAEDVAMAAMEERNGCGSNYCRRSLA
jgi:hypothetical protein